MTDLLKLGKKVFTVSVVALTIVWSVGVAALVPTAVSAETCTVLKAGDLVKATGTSSVYLINSSLQRMYFFNSAVYHTWYKDFSTVQTVSATCLDNYSLSQTPVSTRPGSYLVKSTVTPAVFVVLPNNTREKLADEATAVALYGAKWGTFVLEFPDVYLASYAEVAGAVSTPSNGMLIKKANDNNVYQVVAGKLKLVVGDLAAFVATDVHTVSDATFATLAVDTGTVTSGSLIADPAQGALGNTGTSTGTTTTVITGNLTVSLAADSPVSGNVPALATQNPILKLNFTAGQADAVVTGLNVYRTGLSSDADLGTLYLMDGSSVLATNLGIASGKVMFSLASGLFTVKAGTTRTITLGADLNTASRDYAFSLNAATDVVATGMTVGGSFPISGNHLYTVTVTNPSLANLTINAGTIGGTTNAGTTNVLAGQFTLQAANSNVQVKSIKFTETGTINAATDLANIKLINGATQVGATVPALNADGTVTFDLSANPLLLTSGQTITLNLFADVISGVSRNFQFTVQRGYDVFTKDMTYNVGAVVYSNSAASFTVVPTGTNNRVSVSSGSLTMTRDASSPTSYVAKGSTNQILGAFSVKANGEAVRITGAEYHATWGTARVENTVFNNLKLVDDQGVQLGTTYTSVATGGALTASQNIALTNLNYVVAANTTRILYIKADVISNTGATTLGSTLTNLTAQGYTSLATITAGPSYGNTLSLSGTPWSLSLNNSVGAVQTVAGGTNLKVASFVLSAGPAEGVNLNTVALTTNGDLSTTFINLHVKVNGADFGTVQNNLANTATQYTFTATAPVAMAANTSVVVDVYVDSLTGMSFGAAKVVDLTATNASGATTYVPLGSSMNPSTLAGQNVTLNSAGVVTTSTSATPAITQQVAMGVTAVKVATLKLSDTNAENMNLTYVNIKDGGVQATSYNDIVNFRLMNGTNQVGTAIGSFSNTSGVRFILAIADQVAGKGLVPQNSNMTLDVLADVNTRTNGATSNDVHAYYIDEIGVQGAQSSSSTAVTGQVAGNAASLTVLRTTLLGDIQRTSVGNVDTSYVDNTISDGKVVAKLVFTAGPNDDATLSTITITPVGSEVAAASTTSVTYNFYDGSTLVGTQAMTSTAKTITLSNAGNVFTVGKGTSKVLTIKADLLTAGYAYNTNAKSYAVSITTPFFTFSDGDNGFNADTNRNTLPVSGPGMSF